MTGTIIAIKDSDDRIFGVWLGEQLRMVPGAYYGSGESCVGKTLLPVVGLMRNLGFYGQLHPPVAIHASRYLNGRERTNTLRFVIRTTSRLGEGM